MCRLNSFYSFFLKSEGLYNHLILGIKIISQFASYAVDSWDFESSASTNFTTEARQAIRAHHSDAGDAVKPLRVASGQVWRYSGRMKFSPITHPQSVWLLLLLLLAGSAFPLAVALTSQFMFGLKPCEMCIVQRYPYVAAMLLVAPLFLYRGNAVVLHRLLLLAVLIWVCEAGLAFYHVGIEQQWWESATGCTAQQSSGESLDDLRAAILGSPIVSCSDVAAQFLGLSMASWNVAGALTLAWVGLYFRRKTRMAHRTA